MEVKKNPKANLEKQRLTFILLGLAVTLGIVLLGFEWTTRSGTAKELDAPDMEVEEEIVPVTTREEPPPPEPPKQEKVAEIFEVVEDDVEIEDEMDIVDTEADEETAIDIVEIEETEEKEEEEPVFFIVEQMPEFPGGEIALRKYIAEHVEYPTIARENDIQGKVYIQFEVTKNGNIGQVKVARGVDPLLDKEAIRVVKSLPKWKPGMQRGKPVNVWYTVPINFQLQK